jgi:tetratricopeptide (TPR) repeat protein
MSENKLKICVYAISKNEEKFVKRFYESSKDADLIVLADTGSTDNTVALAKELGIQTHQIVVSPWRFDYARNVALCLIPPDVDVCVSIDLDEELQPGWREEIERVWEKGKTNRLRYKFDWGVGIIFYYEKIHARHGFWWDNICHEVVVPDVRTTNVWATTDMLLVVHKPDPTKSRGQYLDLLKADIIENPNNARNAFYYARELSFNRKWDEAISECDRYLALPDATWANERCYAWRVKGRSYDEMGKGDQAIAAFRQSCIEAPGTREPWVDLATSCYMKKMWNECFFAATQALAITNREWVYTVDPSVWGYKPYDLAAISAWNLGLKDKAIEYGAKAVELEPNDARLANNLKYYREEQ